MKISNRNPATIALAVLLAALLTACVPQLSLHPLYTEETLVFEPALLGTWTTDSDGGSLLFEKEGEKAYNVTYADEGKSSQFKVRLVRLGEFLFLDCTMSEPAGERMIQGGVFQPVLPGHFFGRIVLEGDRLAVALLDDDWVEGKIKAGELKIAHETLENGIVLTAPASDLQEFVLRYAEDSEAFDLDDSESIFHRKR